VFPQKISALLCNASVVFQRLSRLTSAVDECLDKACHLTQGLAAAISGFPFSVRLHNACNTQLVPFAVPGPKCSCLAAPGSRVQSGCAVGSAVPAVALAVTSPVHTCEATRHKVDEGGEPESAVIRNRSPLTVRGRLLAAMIQRTPKGEQPSGTDLAWSACSPRLLRVAIFPYSRSCRVPCEIVPLAVVPLRVRWIWQQEPARTVNGGDDSDDRRFRSRLIHFVPCSLARCGPARSPQSHSPDCTRRTAHPDCTRGAWEQQAGSIFGPAANGPNWWLQGIVVTGGKKPA